MAEPSEKISPSKRPLHFFFRCFGSSPELQSKKNPANGPRDRWVPSFRFRFKKSSATVPVDAAVPCFDEASFSSEFKKPPPSRASVVRVFESIKLSQTRKKPESTQSDSTTERFSPAKRTAALSHSVSLPSRRLTRQKDLKKTVSILPAVATTAPEPSDRRIPTNSPAKKFDPVIVVVIVSVAILVLWGRLPATLCTAALFYFSRRLRSEVEPGGGERRVLNREGRSGFGMIS